MRTIVRLLIALSLTLATSLEAATYIVPTDRDLVMRSEAIVVATAVSSHSELTHDGRVMTIATLALDEVLKGEFGQQATIDLTEPGGAVGDRVTFISGSPRYAAGRQYLVFLRRTADGWATYGFGLGQFQFTTDPFGHQLLARGIGEEISGWDEPDNRSHVEKLRDATAFTAFVKTVAANSGAPARANYLLHPDQSAFTPAPAVSVPGGLDGVSAISAATGNWTGAGAGIHYGVGVSNPNASGGLSTVDHINAVLFNDPAGIIPPGVAAAGGVSDVATVGPNVFTTEVDVVVGKNFSVGQATLNALMTHEMGHTLGLRHSNEGTTNGSACNPPLVCSSNAIMNSAVSVLSLQQWDLDAIRTVYAGQTGTGAPADYLSNTKWQSPPSINFDYCFAPTISGQPSGTSIASGAQTTLNVTATGTSAAYQWYVGNPPNTGTTATNGTTSSLTVSPSTTTTYWVRVTACGGHLDSNGATVTVIACVPPSAPAPNASPSTIASGQSSTITETPTGTGPFTYQWFTGNSGNTASPIGGATNSSVTVSPTTTTSYWVRVTGQCAPPADSPAATVTVAACVPPSASVPIASPSSIPNGQTSTISVTASGTSPFTYQWFIGNSGVTTTPIGGATNSFVVVNPSVTTTYWVRVTGQCAPPVDSREVTVTVTCSPIAPGGVTAQPSAVNAGQSSTLFFSTNGAGPFTIQWYTGGLGDTSNPIPGATGTSTIVTPTGTTGYWVHVTAPCGSQDGSVIVFVNGAPCIAPSITTQPASSSISAGSPVTLTVAAGGTAPFTYQWYTGDKGDVTHPIAGATTFSLTQSPAATTKYWARVSNSCNGTQSADSNAATITVTGPTCINPSITTQPLNASVPIGTSATLKVIAAGTTPLHYQWFQGVKGDTSKPVGTDSATFVSGAIDVNTAFWVHVTGQCGNPADSNAAIVTAIAAPRGRAVRH